MTSYRDLWPADRLARFDKMNAAARKKRLTISVTNIGPTIAPTYMFRIKQSRQVLLYSSCSLDDAERWVKGFPS